jgi:chitin-binding protein
MNEPQTKVQRRKGRIVFPASRGAFAIDLDFLSSWRINEMEGDKKFPAITDGAFPAQYQTDSISVTSPTDGFILSGDKMDARDSVNLANEEMGTTLNRSLTYSLLAVKPSQTLKLAWE